MKTQNSINYNPAARLDGSRRTIRVIENASDGLRLVAQPDRRAFRDGLDGYYVDNFQDSVTVPAVLRLPSAPDGAARLLAATSDPWNDDMYLVDTDIETDERDAWHSAVSLAEHYAESCREDDAKQQAEQQIDDARDEIKSARADYHKLAGELRSLDKALPPGLCAAIRKQIAGHRAAVRGAVKSIRRLTAEPWTAVSNY